MSCHSTINDFFIYNIEKYFKAAGGTNCPANNVIRTSQNCTAASEMLGYSYAYELTSTTRPAGCWYSDQSEKAYFNRNLNPSAVSFDKNIWGGICKKGNVI